MNVYDVYHKRTEPGVEDILEIVTSSVYKKTAETIAYNCNLEINQNENAEYGIEEEYWVETRKFQ